MRNEVDMYIVLLLAVLPSLAVVHSQEPVPNNISACIAPPSGQATVTILGQQGPAGHLGVDEPKGIEGRVGKQGVKGEGGVKNLGNVYCHYWSLIALST